MRALVLYAHPVESSFCAAVHETAKTALARAGHEVDDCNLYAEGFDPVLSRAERLAYHATDANRTAVHNHVARLEAAEALVLVFPVWNFGFPAILKGYFDRVFVPGVSFRLENGRVKPNLRHIRALVAITTYGGPRIRAWLAGDPPRRIVMRVVRNLIAPSASARYLALYDMNRADDRVRTMFLDRVERALGRLG